jgi:peptidoglycan/xylan/chitin deacetylase (PgdA/CDA1 family)
MFRSAVKNALYGTGLFGGWHRRRNKNALTIVLFHRVLKQVTIEPTSPEAPWIVSENLFRQCLRFFHRHYNVVRLSDVWANRYQARPLPPNPLVITFDDGWTDNESIAMPVLQEFVLPAVFFVNTGVIDTDGTRWLSGAQLRELHRQGMEIGIHGVEHRSMTSLADDHLMRDLHRAKQSLDDQLGEPAAWSLSFPHGHYDKRTVDIARRCDFGIMLTSDPLLNLIGADGRCADLLGRISVHSSWISDAKGDLIPENLAGWLFVRQRAVLSA